MNTKDARKAAGVMRVIIDQALANVVKDNPEVVSSLKIKTIRFDENGFHTTLEAVWTDGLTPDAAYYDIAAKYEGLPARGEHFISRGHAYEIVGMRKGGNIVAKDAQGKQWLFKQEAVKRFLNISPKIAEFKINLD